MVTCSCCGKTNVLMPYTCKFCGNHFCADHHLPENHECEGLKRYKKEASDRFKRGVIKGAEDIGRPSRRDYHPERHHPTPHTHSGGTRLRMPKLPKFVIILLFLAAIFGVESLAMRDFVYPTFYILVAVVAGSIIYVMFKWASRLGAGSDLSLFGLRILSGLISAAGMVLLVLWLMFAIWSPMISFTSQNPLADPKIVAASVFVVVFGFGLLLLGAFLYFRFMRRSGVIVYPR